MKEAKRIKSILTALNKAEDKLHMSQSLIEDTLSLIETAFLMHDKELVDHVEKDRKSRKKNK